MLQNLQYPSLLNRIIRSHQLFRFSANLQLGELPWDMKLILE